MSKEQVVAEVAKKEAIHSALRGALADIQSRGIAKTFDQEVCIIVALNAAGFEIVRRPRRDGLRLPRFHSGPRSNVGEGT